jgi:hypothetical protein
MKKQMKESVLCEDGLVVYSEEMVEIFAKALRDAFNSVGYDWRCFDWLSYRPDFYLEAHNRAKTAMQCAST